MHPRRHGLPALPDFQDSPCKRLCDCTISLAQTDWTSGYADVGISGGTDEWGVWLAHSPWARGARKGAFFLTHYGR
jgi:hypothetical protein